MGILPMSLTGVPPVSLALLLVSLQREETEEAKTMGGMPMGLMAKMAMLRVLIITSCGCRAKNLV
jgi:hypothetical protein